MVCFQCVYLANGAVDQPMGKGALKVSAEAVDEVVSGYFQLEIAGKIDVGGGAGEEIEGQDGGGCGADGARIDAVDDGFVDGYFLEYAHVESVHVVPEIDLLLFVLLVLNGADVEDGLVVKYEPVGGEPLVASEDYRVEHRFVEEEVPHPFGNDDVDGRGWEGHFFDFAVY